MPGLFSTLLTHPQRGVFQADYKTPFRCLKGSRPIPDRESLRLQKERRGDCQRRRIEERGRARCCLFDLRVIWLQSLDSAAGESSRAVTMETDSESVVKEGLDRRTENTNKNVILRGKKETKKRRAWWINATPPFKALNWCNFY